MELISGDLFTGAHRATMEANDAIAERIKRLCATPRQQVGNVPLTAGADDASNLGLRKTGRAQVCKNLLKVAHGLNDNACAIKRKREPVESYDVSVTHSRGGTMTVGDRLREARKARGLSQSRLAQISGISQTTVSDIERGRNTSSTALPTLAAVLGVSALWISTGRGPRHDGPPVRPVAPQRQINSRLMVEAWHAVTAYQAQTGSRLDDDELLTLACRLYEQHIDSPGTPASEMLGYLVSLTRAIGRADPVT